MATAIASSPAFATHEHHLLTPGTCVEDVAAGQTARSENEGGHHEFYDKVHKGQPGTAAFENIPLWAVGCGWAFQSAEWLVDETADALLGDGDLERALRRYGKVHRARLAGHHSSIADFSTGRPLNAVERLMFSAAARDEKTLRHFHAFGSRLIGVRRFLAPGAVGRALWVNARRGRGASYAG